MRSASESAVPSPLVTNRVPSAAKHRAPPLCPFESHSMTNVADAGSNACGGFGDRVYRVTRVKCDRRAGSWPFQPTYTNPLSANLGWNARS